MASHPTTPEELREAIRAAVPQEWRDAMDRRNAEDQERAEAGRRRNRGGRPPAAEPRESRVTVRFTSAEREQLARVAAEGEVGEFIRAAALRRAPKLARQVPALNAEAWRDLAPVVANLNQLARHANEGRAVGRDLVPVLDEVRRHVVALRAALLGRDERPGDDCVTTQKVELP